MSAIDRNRAANERHGGCANCDALRAEVAALREEIEDLKGRGFSRGLVSAEVGYQAIEERDAARRELAEARALLAQVLNYPCMDAMALTRNIRAFLHRDEARGAAECPLCSGQSKTAGHSWGCPARDEAPTPSSALSKLPRR